MRKTNSALSLSRKFIALLAAILLTTSNAFADPSQYLIEKYLDKYDDLGSKGYTKENGISLDASRKPNALVVAICRPFGKTKSVDCVLVITEILSHDASGHATRASPSEMIHVQLPRGWDYFDTRSTGCKSSKYPDSEIIAIGKWKNRKEPLTGGYAHSIKNAWRIDYQKLRFVEIPARDVSCGFDDDRN
ncbi:MAG: hypothetical protein U1E04_04645 [Hylemonella sp.]|nr:hypothetical protein [Hylemonella sp.]